MRVLRAVRARPGSWLLLAALVAVLVAAGVVATGASAGAARSGAFLPLVLIAVVTVPVPGLELARRRRSELALVRVRGGYGPRLVGSTLGEPLWAVLVGAVLGTVAGAVVQRLLHSSWGVPALVGGDELNSAVELAALAAVLAVGSTVVVAREPLAVALRRSAWSGAGTRAELAALVAGVGVLVAAGLAVYRSRSGAPGTLVLAGTALVGLAAGQALVWLHRLLAGRAGLFASSSIPLLLGVRRALGAEHAATVRVLVAAGAVAASAAGAVTAADAWADDSARIRSGAPVQLALPDAAALETLLLTRRLDPDGEWLMAAAVNDDRGEARLRVAWLDLARYERVAGAHLSGTPAALGSAVDRLVDAPAVRLLRGDTVTVATAAPSPDVTVRLDYLDDEGTVTSAQVEVAQGAGSTPVTDCAESCVVLGVGASVPTEVTALRLGDIDLLAEHTWVREGGTGAGDPGPLALTEDVVLRPADGQAAEPMLAAGRLELEDGPPLVEGIGGTPRPLEVVGERSAVPLVSGAGLVGDLPVALAATGGSIPAVRSLVLARADTPQDVLAGLQDAGAEAPRRWGPAHRELSDRELAEERVSRTTGLAAVAVAVLVLLAGTGRRARSLRNDRAALRLVGVPARLQRRAGVVEATVLALSVGLATGLAARLAASVVDGSDVVTPGGTGLPFGSTVSDGVVVAVALGAALLAAAHVLLARGGGVPADLLTEAEHR